ncbi:hypothetical protein CROQUDRAFT_104950 [Cronartium quercuum f. sp. fusiforme G11]|uniref:Uncharacterized protein n=1 Tax=Cronartium quercuum f. sp. fusiforme G11 TaxID=708437 RepID=A0A9P6TEQ3_9BASI|nr:hypothetical protein CROQUDRAFT_104950 [Cronartium quercuum f. sp. fusiforme G11]
MSKENIVIADEETDAPTSTAHPHDIASVIAKALKQQAMQFERIVGNLQSQIATMDVKNKAIPMKEKAKEKAPSSAQSKPSTPAACKSFGSSNSTSKTTKSPKTPSTPTPVRKKQPFQIRSDETPQDFKSVKEALYVHIKMMWGLYKQSDVPPAPDPAMLTEFYAKFNSIAEVEAVVNNPSSANLIAQECLMVNAQQVCFLPNAAESLLPNCHPDEFLSNVKFSAKYLDVLLEAYKISDDKEGNVEDDEEDIIDEDEDLNSDDGGVDEEEEEEFYAEGEYGNLYDYDSDEEVAMGAASGEASGSGSGAASRSN